jgi:hypothetical protein
VFLEEGGVTTNMARTHTRPPRWLWHGAVPGLAAAQDVEGGIQHLMQVVLARTTVVGCGNKERRQDRRRCIA